MKNDWVTIERFEVVDQAAYHREMLENAGILVSVEDEGGGEVNTSGALPGAHGGVALKVREEDAQRAGTVLEEESTRLMGGG